MFRVRGFNLEFSVRSHFRPRWDSVRPPARKNRALDKKDSASDSIAKCQGKSSQQPRIWSKSWKYLKGSLVLIIKNPPCQLGAMAGRLQNLVCGGGRLFNFRLDRIPWILKIPSFLGSGSPAQKSRLWRGGLIGRGVYFRFC